MRRIKSNYHTLQVLKTAKYKLLETIISYRNKNLSNSIRECVLKEVDGNIPLSEYAKRKLRNHKSNLRSFADKRLLLTARKGS